MDGSEADVPPAPSERGWLQAAALFLLAYLMRDAVRPSVLIGVCYVLMVVALPVRRWPAYTLGGLMVALAVGGSLAGRRWVDVGWALLVGAWFVALTMRWPSSRFISRALGAIGGAGALASVLIAQRAGGWSLLDSQLGDRFRKVVVFLLEERSRNPDAEALAPAMVTMLYRVAEAQAALFPALLALGTLAGLGTAWWIYTRIGRDVDDGLLPLREFRFNDHLVWLFVGGLALLLVRGDGVRRVGLNVVVFMAALYALRGAAVIRFFGGERLFARAVLPALLFTLVLLMTVGGTRPADMMVIFPWMVQTLMTAVVVIGLCDTWLDLRGRARALTA